MSAIIQKLQEISKLDVTLPISNETIKLNKINKDNVDSKIAIISLFLFCIFKYY